MIHMFNLALVSHRIPFFFYFILHPSGFTWTWERHPKGLDWALLWLPHSHSMFFSISGLGQLSLRLFTSKLYLATSKSPDFFNICSKTNILSLLKIGMIFGHETTLEPDCLDLRHFLNIILLFKNPSASFKISEPKICFAFWNNFNFIVLHSFSNLISNLLCVVYSAYVCL